MESSGKVPRKRFKPNAPPPRNRRAPLLIPKAEDEEIKVDEAEAERLYQLYKEKMNLKVRPKTEREAKPVQVTFDVGGSTTTRKSYKSSNANIKNEASYATIKNEASYATIKNEASYGNIKNEASYGNIKNEAYIKNEASSSDGFTSQSVEIVEKKYKEPWDYNYSIYPAVLPMRRPFSGNPEVLDAEEFGEEPIRTESVENDTNTAEKLGLLHADDEGLEPNMFFLQLPTMLPEIVAQSGKPESSKDSGKSKKLCKLESLPEGLIGKMLVYKSGAVKLKIGDTIYNVSAGLECMHAQDVVAVNAEKKQCCNLGELSKRAMATPDIDSMLEAMLEL